MRSQFTACETKTEKRENGSTLERHLVHRHHDSEVFLSDPLVGNDEVSFGFCFDPFHHMIAPSFPSIPLVVMLEGSRQLGIAAAHLLGRIPVEMAAVATRLGFRWESEIPFYETLASPGVRATVRIHTMIRLPDGSHAVELVSRLYRRRHHIGTAWGAITWLSRRAYRKLRGIEIMNTTAGTYTDHGFLTGVTNTPRWAQGGLTWDHQNTFFFDHHGDHVPGIVLAAAALEGHALLRKAGLPASIDMRFIRYGELNQPVSVETNLDNPRKPSMTSTTFTQSHRPICTATIHKYLPRE